MDAVRTLSSLSHEAFRLGSSLRSARFFHPRGVVLAGRLELTGDGPLPAGATDCEVRVSKAIGLPGGAPDILGVGIRYLDGDAPVDVLLATSAGTDRVRRLTLWPAASWGRARFTSLLPWQSGDGTRALVVAEVDDPRLGTVDVRELAARLPVRFALRVPGLQQGELVVTGPERPTIDFDPVLHQPPGWHFVPRWLSRVRRASYAGSRAGRPDTAG